MLGREPPLMAGLRLNQRPILTRAKAVVAARQRTERGMRVRTTGTAWSASRSAGSVMSASPASGTTKLSPFTCAPARHGRPDALRSAARGAQHLIRPFDRFAA